MRSALLCVLLAAPAAAEEPAATSTAAVSASSATAPTDAAAGRAVKDDGGAPAPKPERLLRAVIHKEAVDWEPLSLRAGAYPGPAETSVTLKVVKLQGRLRGETSKAKASVRVHQGLRDSRWLVVSVRAKPLELRRAHLELRFRVFEGYVEEAQAALVAVADRRRAPSSPALDSFDLRAEGIEYQEELPGSGALFVSALDSRPRADARNSGRLEKAEFADRDVGFVNLSWSARGVAGSK